jgi:acetate kinase
MKILVANLGSTSFKFRLFEMRSEAELARGGTERIGSDRSRSTVTVGDWSDEDESPMPDHPAALHWALAKLTTQPLGCIASPGEIAAVGF